MINRVFLFCGHSSKVYMIEQCLDESKQLASWLMFFFTRGLLLGRAIGLSTFLAACFLAAGFSGDFFWQQASWRPSSWASFRSLDRDGSFQMHQCLWTTSSWCSSLQCGGPNQSRFD